MKVKPLHDRVIVRRIDEHQRTADGIIMPDTATEQPMQGEVKAGVTVAKADAPGDDEAAHGRRRVTPWRRG
jgi:chaperonin GroES